METKFIFSASKLPTADNFGTDFSLYWGDTNEYTVS